MSHKYKRTDESDFYDIQLESVLCVTPVYTPLLHCICIQSANQYSIGQRLPVPLDCDSDRKPRVQKLCSD